jgi:hypothetical protein
MSADIIQFVPRPNPKADRAFWLGGDSPIQDTTPYRDPPLDEYVKSAGYDYGNGDTAPAEYVAPTKDPA